jgi:uncharacterized membrane protein
MKFSIKREIVPLLFILLPYLYLAAVWNRMPEKLPLHWNSNNEIDNWGGKGIAWLLPLIIPGGLYALMWLILFIDPKQKLQQMDRKFHQLKLVLTITFSLFTLLVFYYAQKNEFKNGTHWIIVFEGILFASMGNFFQALKPNYFIGIKSPWTLESEIVWRKTHKVFGWVWVAGGLAMIALPFVLPPEITSGISGMLTFVVFAALPYLYSFVIWKWPSRKQVQQEP